MGRVSIRQTELLPHTVAAARGLRPPSMMLSIDNRRSPFFPSHVQIVEELDFFASAAFSKPMTIIRLPFGNVNGYRQSIDLQLPFDSLPPICSDRQAPRP